MKNIMKERIGVDFDDTLVPFSDRAFIYVNSRLPKALNNKNAIRADYIGTPWDIFGLGVEEYLKYLDDFTFDESFIETAEPMSYAFEVLTTLKENGYDPFVKTARKEKVGSRNAQKKLEQILDKLYPEIFSDVYSLGNFGPKIDSCRKYGGVALIDDNPSSFDRPNDEHFTSVLFDINPWNKDYDTKKNGIVRANDWLEVPNYLK